MDIVVCLQEYYWEGAYVCAIAGGLVILMAAFVALDASEVRPYTARTMLAGLVMVFFCWAWPAIVMSLVFVLGYLLIYWVSYLLEQAEL